MSFSIFTRFKATDGVTPAFDSMIRKGNIFKSQAARIQSSFVKSFGSVGKSFGKLKSGFSSTIDKVFAFKNAIMAVVAGVVIQKIAGLGKAWVDLASDLIETQGKIDVVFGNMSTQVHEWAKTSIKSMGLAKQSALDSAALFGDMGTGMGLSQKRAAEMAMTLTQLGADLASFKNISNSMATTALKSIYTGETESLKNLGVVMTQANLKEFARSKGLKKKIKDLKEAEKVELRYLYVMERTKNAQGDFLRTGGNAANQMRINSEVLKEIQTNWGMIILPAYNKMLTKANELLMNNMPLLQKSFENLFSVVSKGFQIGNVFKPLTDAIKADLPQIKGWFQDFSKTVGPMFADFFKENFPTIISIFKELWNVGKFLIPIFLEICTVVIKYGLNIISGILTALNGLITFITGIFTGKWKKAFKGLGDFVVGIFKGIWELIKGVFALIVDVPFKSSNKMRESIIKDKKSDKKKVPGFATGTNYYPGGLAWVGERGPELVDFPSGTKIYNNNKSINMVQRLSKPVYSEKVLNFEKYLERRERIEAVIDKQKEDTIILEVDFKTPEGYEAKIINAKSTGKRNFKARLKGKTKQ